MTRSGVERTNLAFILTDSQISHESFLEDVNNVLNTGEIPNLFSKKEDLDAIFSGMRTWASKNKKPENPEALWSYFVQGVRDNLHIILAMSPVGESLRVRCRKFPSLVNCCTLDWFSNWPENALLEVASKFLQNAEGIESAELKESICKMCVIVSVGVT